MARELGATHVISVGLPPAAPGAAPNNMIQVVSRCFQILQSRCENSWRGETDLVIAPDVRGADWNAFGRRLQLVQAGEAAAAAVISKIQEWLSPRATFPVSIVQMAIAY